MHGLRGKKIETLAYRRALRIKKRGFSLVEILIVALLLTIIVFALLTTLNTGEVSNSVSTAKADLQAKVRQAMDWIIKDVRQTNLIQINTNNPLGNHIKFKQVTGIDGAGNYALSANYIEYTYNSASQQLTRNEVDDFGVPVPGSSRVFSNITQSPFYSEAGVALAPGAILVSKKLIVVISGENQVNINLTLNFSLTEEVKIRNE